jgi:hypothetical protein
VYFEPLVHVADEPANSGQEKRKQLAAGLIGLATGLFLAFIGQFLNDD